MTGKREMNKEKPLLDSSWNNLKDIVIYGFGRSSHGNILKFIEDFNVLIIVDNNPSLNGKKYNNISIVSQEESKEYLKKNKIIILAAGIALRNIKDSLEKLGLKENADFCDMNTFMNEWYWKQEHSLCLGKVGISVTELCSLNCQNCNMFMPFYREPHNFELKMLCNDLDMFFSLVDSVSSFVIIGGEPFLYPQLKNYLMYIGEKYRKKIANLQIITNGTIVPDETLLKVIADNDVEIRISEYARDLVKTQKIEKLRYALSQYNIQYIVFSQTEWLDFGFPYQNVNMGNTREEIRRHMLNCHGMCYWLHDGKYYYCSDAWSAHECGLYSDMGRDEYIDLNELLLDESNGKNELRNYYIGNMKKGYISFCRVCRGFGSDNTKRVRAAIQLEKGTAWEKLNLIN